MSYNYKSIVLNQNSFTTLTLNVHFEESEQNRREGVTGITELKSCLVAET